MKGPAVYRGIAAVTAALSRQGIAKDHHNAEEGWAFRGIDDVYNALSPLLAKHRLCILPRILERQASQRRDNGGGVVCHVALKVVFEFVSAMDGSSHSVEIWGEGTDRADKATNKALASAYKYAAFQVFCIPVAGQVDGDAETIRLGSASAASPTSATSPMIEPVQGWAQWVSDIIDMVGGCQTEEAVVRLQVTYRRELHALSSFDAAGYRRIGEAVAELKRRIAKPSVAARGATVPSKPPAAELPPKASRKGSKQRTAATPVEEDALAAASA